MIYIDKVIQILKVLYPNRIEPEDLFEVYENVIPQIQKLIDGVALGYHSEKLIEREYVEAVADTSWMRDKPVHDADVVTQKQPMSVNDIPLHTFKEEDKHEIDASWTELQFGKGMHYRKGDALVIKGESSRIDTAWAYLTVFFNSLSDETIIRDVGGLNKKKQKTLFNFYISHPNFSCHIDKVNNTNVFMKDEVRVNAPTGVSGDGGTMDADGFNEVSDE